MHIYVITVALCVHHCRSCDDQSIARLPAAVARDHQRQEFEPEKHRFSHRHLQTLFALIVFIITHLLQRYLRFMINWQRQRLHTCNTGLSLTYHYMFTSSSVVLREHTSAIPNISNEQAISNFYSKHTCGSTERCLDFSLEHQICTYQCKIKYKSWTWNWMKCSYRAKIDSH